MDLITRNIHRNRQKGRTVTQVTLDDDFIVPDTKEDMEALILDSAAVELEDTRLMGTRLAVKGRLVFRVLYHTQKNRMVDNMEGALPFEEFVNVSDVAEDDDIRVDWDIEDLTASMINSRKLNMKTVITLTVTAEELRDEAVTVEVDGGEGAETVSEYIEAAQIAVQTRDTYRVKEEVELSASKPNIAGLLWQELTPRGIECRPLDGKLSIHGEMELFCIYRGEEEHVPLQWVERSIPFSGSIEMPECTDEMIPAIDIRPVHWEVEAKADYDGEMRLLSAEAVLELDIRLYEELRVGVLSDIYCPGADVILESSEAHLEHLVTRNASKYKMTDKLTLGAVDKILQICHAGGSVKLDSVEPVENGLSVEGTLCVDVLYVAADDLSPVRNIRGMLPFSYTIEASGIRPGATFRVKPGLEQLSAMLLGNGELEIKAVIVLDSLVMEPLTLPVIRSAQIMPLDPARLEALPGIVGYVVQKGDTLWKIAKKFYASVDNIRETNGLGGDELEPGQRLLIIKQAERL
ncbi:MAG: DUF3794 domain-containing protein [Lachnospiraceae bacterium]|jgi:nucleoid-associated protein YgaU|nr:DUF3794 domain-containing protein [Lachnospiraceae bacterium]